MGYIAAFVAASLLGLFPLLMDLYAEPKSKRAKRRVKIAATLAGAIALVAGIFNWYEGKSDTAHTQAALTGVALQARDLSRQAEDVSVTLDQVQRQTNSAQKSLASQTEMVDQLADSLAGASKALRELTEAQARTLEKAWRLQRPLGQWEGRLEIRGLVPNHSEVEQRWARAAVAEAFAHTEIEADGVYELSETYSQADREGKNGTPNPIAMSIGAVVFTPEPVEMADPRAWVKSRGITVELQPISGRFDLRIQRSTRSITSVDAVIQFRGSMRANPNAAIRNWVDLYGSTMSWVTYGALAYPSSALLQMEAATTVDSNLFNYQCVNDCRAKIYDAPPVARGVFVETVTEENAGPMSADYRAEFPDRAADIESRLRKAARERSNALQ